MGGESSSAIRAFVVILLGAVVGLAGGAVVRHLFDLPIDVATLRSAWVGMAASGVGGALVLLIATQLMAQSPPHIARWKVILILLFGSALLGAIAASAILLVMRFINYGFFQGRGVDVVLRSVGVCAGLGAAAFLVAVPIRGFDLKRTAKAPAPKGEKRIRGRRAVTKGIQVLRSCPECGSVVVKPYEASDPKAAKKGMKRYVCNRGHEWHA
jgi:hypothetical protein